MEKECWRESSFRHRFKLKVCCFSGMVDADHDYKQLQPFKTSISPCTWRKKFDLKSRSVKSRKHHRRSRSADFSYDPSSYALNFQDDSRLHDHDFPSRFTVSPPTPSSAPPSL